MRETYEFHEHVLKLLQWHCKPNLWHLRTPVHMFALDAFVEAYPNAKFLWSHRDPAKVLGSVCSLIAYIRSWSSDRKDPQELGAEQLAWWAEGIRRAMDFRKKFGDDRFVDVSFADLQTEPVKTVANSYEQLGLTFTDSARAKVQQWADEHKPGHRGTHDIRTRRLRADNRSRCARPSASTSRPTTRRREDPPRSEHWRNGGRDWIPIHGCASRFWPPRRKIVREEGVRALSVAQVLGRAGLSTRAFYRHFDSKDQLVSAVFLEMARVEMLRLRSRRWRPESIRSARWRRGSTGAWTWLSTTRIRSDLRQMSLGGAVADVRRARAGRCRLCARSCGH